MPDFTIRSAMPDDAGLIVSLLRALADYEKLLEKFSLTEGDVRRDFFGDRRLVTCELAFAGGVGAGIATGYWTYGSFAAARGFFLEDLFVPPEFRGRGIGKALLAHMAARTIAAGGTRMDWQVLDWNIPAQDFYKSLGARMVGDWLTCRLDGAALAACGDA